MKASGIYTSGLLVVDVYVDELFDEEKMHEIPGKDVVKKYRRYLKKRKMKCLENLVPDYLRRYRYLYHRFLGIDEKNMSEDDVFLLKSVVLMEESCKKYERHLARKDVVKKNGIECVKKLFNVEGKVYSGYKCVVSGVKEDEVDEVVDKVVSFVQGMEKARVGYNYVFS